MKSKREVKLSSRVARREASANGNARPPRPHAMAGRLKRPAAGAPPPPPAAGAPSAYEELLHFFNESADLLCIASFDGKFKRLNPAWQPVLGWTLAELQARPFLDFVHPDDHPATLAEMDTLATGAPTIIFENRYHCKDGSWKWLQWTASPLPGRQEIYAIARDVTLQKRLEREILDTLESERERVGRDLHDSLGPHLAAIRYAATLLANDLRQRAQPEATQADKIDAMAHDAITLARNLARGIFPVQINGAGLALALDELASTTSRQTEMSVSFYETGDTQVEDPKEGMHLYRIAQEALTNARKHGGARQVTIVLSKSEDSLHLAIADDGKGMAPSPNGTRGMGLDSMHSRARALGGELKIESNPGEGTIVSCEIPNRSPRPATPAS